MTNEGPNIIHPEKASAVGSRNSLNRKDRDENKESKSIVDEEVDKILNHLNSKLPPEVLSKLHISSTVKDLLHNYFNQGMQNMLSRYLTTVEDEMAKKFRDFVNSEERIGLNSHTAIALPDLLNDIGGEDKFNTAELEKSVVNIYGHLQGHMQRSEFELEQETNDILRHRVDVGAFIRGENIHSIVKCAFTDSLDKPDNVTDINLCTNILDGDLISTIYHYLLSPKVIMGHLISETVIHHIDVEVEKIDNVLLDKGKMPLTYNEQVFKKIKLMNSVLEGEGSIQGNKVNDIFKLGQKILQIVKGVPSDISKMTSEPLRFSHNVTKLLNEDFVRNRGYSTAVNTITAILDTSKMGYQYIENNKNARQLIIREYEDTDNLPDEHYEIYAYYLDQEQLRELRVAYLQQFDDFESQIQKVYSVCEHIYQDAKKALNIVDYDSVKKEFLVSSKRHSFFGFLLSKFGISNNGDSEEQEDRIWDEIIFIEPTPTNIEKTNSNFNSKKNRILALMVKSKEIIESVFERRYPIERICIEEKIDFIKASFQSFLKTYNPFHCNPGLVLQMNLSTIKRKQTTLRAMSNVLNEFFYGISTQFQDKAFADFKRRRSTDTTDTYEKFINSENANQNE